MREQLCVARVVPVVYMCSHLRRLVKIERHWDSTIQNLEVKAAESVRELEISHRKQRRELAQVRSRIHN